MLTARDVKNQCLGTHFENRLCVKWAAAQDRRMHIGVCTSLCVRTSLEALVGARGTKYKIAVGSCSAGSERDQAQRCLKGRVIAVR